ncbi:hypothetical protein [Flammeovirga kamogawensis]|uniref:GIY-YIG nuclease family protein n=1 Tax=Flammeovirga kamogawensis TaxID=373891 RepID=A0ABX8H3B2_9BACT|nr:hypothetical protein [Flammeovirga kamogawensis]MBB6460299.1 hypothetical protein [Flammeovirga kamogawensis]QWG10109.1 hypothetical protein KM029_20720 [Flammeovirga kamogawensis]TRX65616.1 hypothetical protein EO216_24150 [Flammeovirga kamogawensis]
MKFNLKNRDTSGVLIAYVKFGSESFFCLADVEYCIGTSWFMHVASTKGSLELEYFNFIKKFRLDYQDLYLAYRSLDLTDIFEKEGNKPCIYIDFSQKYFASYYQEQELEERVSKEWKGEYKNVITLVPKEYRYWE